MGSQDSGHLRMPQRPKQRQAVPAQWTVLPAVTGQIARGIFNCCSRLLKCRTRGKGPIYTIWLGATSIFIIDPGKGRLWVFWIRPAIHVEQPGRNSGLCARNRTIVTQDGRERHRSRQQGDCYLQPEHKWFLGCPKSKKSRRSVAKNCIRPFTKPMIQMECGIADGPR